MDHDPFARLGEDWLQANDPAWKPSRDFDHKARAIGLSAQVETASRRKGARLLGHDVEPSAICCVRCLKPFEPTKNGHQYCGDICRAAARRDYMRELMRRRRAA